MSRTLLLPAVLALLAADPRPAGAGAEGGAPSSYVETLAGTTVSFEMRKIDAGRLVVDAAGAEGGSRALEVETFWIGTTEVTWDQYDVFVFGLDGKAAVDVDAESRPTKPYINADRGFGHAGFAAMSIAHRGAVAYCEWLSKKTGRRYRLPTEDEWEYACRAGGTAAFSCGDDVEGLAAVAWYRANADHRTHPVGTLAKNAFGLHDMHGNVAEWVLGRDGKPVVKGGSYVDGADRLACDARQAPSRLWNASDPQIPKSVWWLCDAGFVGFRVVCEDGPGPAHGEGVEGVEGGEAGADAGDDAAEGPPATDPGEVSGGD